MHIFYSNCYPEEDCEGGSGLIYCGRARGVSNFLYLFVESVLPDTRSKEYFIICVITFKIIIRTIYNINILYFLLNFLSSFDVFCYKCLLLHCKNIQCRANCTLNIKVVCIVKHNRASIDKAQPDQCQ